MRRERASVRSRAAEERASARRDRYRRHELDRQRLTLHEQMAREAAAREVEAVLNARRAPAAVEGVSLPQEGTSLAVGRDAAEGSGAWRGEQSSPFTEHISFNIRRYGMPAPLRGSLASLERQDERLEAEGLKPIENEADLSARIARRQLVPLPVSADLTVNAQLPLHHRYCRPWTARFLSDLARAHEAVFHRPIEVSSAVRTAVYQERLMRINGNAAPAFGAVFSPHLMGATIDIAKKQMSRAEIAWMRRNLLALELAGKIDVEEEFEQACFHITVYESYAPALAPRPWQKPVNQDNTAAADSGALDPGGQ